MKPTLALSALLLASGAPAHGQPPLGLEQAARTILEACGRAPADPAGARRALSDFLRADPASPLAELAASEWLDSREHDPDPRGGADELEGLLGIEGLHGLARLLLAEAAAGDAAAAGDLERWRALHPGRNDPARYLALGPLGDFADDQHGVAFPPEIEGIDLRRPLPGASGAVRWRPMTRPWNKADLEPWQGLKHGKGAWYVLFQLRSQESRPAWLLLKPRGSIEAWWNGARVADIHSPSEPIPARLIIPVALAAGWNRLVLKLTEAGATRPSVAFLDELGNPLAGLAEEQDLRLHPLPAGDAPAVEPFLDARALLEREEGPWAGLLLARHLQHLGYSSAGLERARGRGEADLERLPPLWRVLYALRLLESMHLPADYRRNRCRELLEAAAGAPGEAALLAKLQLGELLLEDDKGEDTVRMMQEMLADRPGFYPAERLLHAAYRRLGWEGEEARQTARLRALAPLCPEYPIRQAVRLSALGDLPAAYAALGEALRLDQGDLGLLARARRLAVSCGRLEEAEALLAREAALSPDSEGIQAEAARLAEFRGNARRALELLAELAARNPSDPSWLERAADLRLATGETEEAARLLRRALEADPSQIHLRRRLASLEGRDWGAELAAHRIDIEQALRGFQMRADFEESHSVLVVDHMVIQIFEDGSWINEIHQLRRINDQQGVDDFGNAQPQGDLVRLRAFLPDGTVSEPINVMGSYEIPGLAPGAFIEELYRDFGWDSRRQPWENANFVFSSGDEPFLWSRLIVHLPARRRGEFRWGGGLPAPAVEERGETSVWTFEVKQAGRIVREQNMPFDREVIPWVLYGEDRPLEEAGRELRERLLRRLRGSREIDLQTAQATAGAEGDEAKARAIYEFVQRHVPDRPGSADPTSILLKREGERWFLLAAMLRSAEIPAELGLAHPFSPGTDEDPMPVFQNTATLSDWFQIPLLRILPRNGGAFWVPAGAPRNLPFGTVPAALAGAPALLLRAGAPALERLPEVDLGTRALLEADGSILLGKGKEASGEFRLSFPGQAGWSLKESLLQATSDQRERFVRARLAPLFRGAVLRSFSLEGLDAPAEPLLVRIRLRFPNFLQREGGKPVVPIVLMPANLGELVERPTRTWPFVFRDYSVLRWKVVIDPGSAWRIDAAPASAMVLHPILSWQLCFRREGARLSIERDLALVPGRFSAGEYPRFISLCRSVDEAEGRKIILAPAGGD